MTEVRTVSATGGEKGRKPQQIGTIDPVALLALAEVGGFGAEKYSAYNYLKGYDWSLSYDAAQRHLMEFWAGNDTDDESGLLHVLHAGWHCLAMASFLLRELGTDDRFKAVDEVITDETATCAVDADERLWVKQSHGWWRHRGIQSEDLDALRRDYGPLDLGVHR